MDIFWKSFNATILALQSKRNSTKTRNRRDLSFEGRKFMMEGPLKWETDLYIFIRAMFNEKMRRLGIEQSPLNVTWRQRKTMLTVNANCKPWSVLSLYNIIYIIWELENFDRKLFFIYKEHVGIYLRSIIGYNSTFNFDLKVFQLLSYLFTVNIDRAKYSKFQMDVLINYIKTPFIERYLGKLYAIEIISKKT